MDHREKKCCQNSEPPSERRLFLKSQNCQTQPSILGWVVMILAEVKLSGKDIMTAHSTSSRSRNKAEMGFCCKTTRIYLSITWNNIQNWDFRVLLVPEKSLQKVKKIQRKKNLTAFQQNSITNWLLSCSEFVEIRADRITTVSPSHKEENQIFYYIPKECIFKIERKKVHFWVEKLSLNNINAKLFQHVISRQAYIIYGAHWLQHVYRQRQQ